MTVAISSPVTDAALALLGSLQWQVGDAARPPGPKPGPRSFYPYGVLYTGATRMDGTLLDPKEDALHRVQVTAVGLDRAGAEDYRDNARQLLLDPANWDIDGFAVVWTELVTSQPVTRDNDVDPPLFYAIDVINVFVTPVSS